MEKIINIRVEKLPEGMYLATSREVQGLVAQGRTLWETMEIARDVAHKLFVARAEKAPKIRFPKIARRVRLPLVVEF